jgi:hypothetical protein
MNRKVERLLLFDLPDRKRQRITLSLLPSRRFMSGAAPVLAASAGPSMLASTSTLELFIVPLFSSSLSFDPLQQFASLSMRRRYNSAKLRQRTEQLESDLL